MLNMYVNVRYVQQFGFTYEKIKAKYNMCSLKSKNQFYTFSKL